MAPQSFWGRGVRIVSSWAENSSKLARGRQIYKHRVGEEADQTREMGNIAVAWTDVST